MIHSPYVRKKKSQVTLSNFWQSFSSCISIISRGHYLLGILVWHGESSPVNHSDIQFSRSDDLPPVCHFYQGLVSSLFFVILDSSFHHSDNANYFKLSGRQVQFQLNCVFLCWPWGGKQGCSLSPEQFHWQLWVPFKKKFKLNFSLTSVNTSRVHPCQDRRVLSICIPVTHLMW